MRASLVAVVMIAAACHPPTLQDRARQAGHKLSAVGHKVAAIVHVRPVTVAAVANAPQVNFQRHVTATSATSATSTAAVPVTVQRIDHTQAPSYVAHYKNAAGTWTCSAYPTMDECTRNCTVFARQTGACNCVEGESCL